jgi:hypothetical protein
MKWARRVWLLVLLAALVAAAGGLAYGLLGNEIVKGALDGLAPDGDFERLSRGAYEATQIWGLIVGSLSLLVGLVFLIQQERTQDWVANALEWLGARRAALRADAGSYWAQLAAARPRGRELWLLLAITLAGAILRALLLDRPMQHDEAYSFIAFASRGLRIVLTDYHLPNNHVLHTFLMWLSTNLFGETPWALRLPAYLAGVALIPASYAAGRLAFGRATGLLAAALVAFNTYFIHFSTDGRGYTLMILLAVLCWCLAMQLLRGRNSFAWLLLTLFGALGFWVMPTMVYPYAAVMAWLGLSALLGDRDPGYPAPRFWRDAIVSGLSTMAIMLALYIPIFLNWDFNAVFNNSIISIMRDDNYEGFFQNLGSRWGDSWGQWHEGLGPLLLAIGVAAFALGLLRHLSKKRRWRLSLPLIGLAVVLAIMLLQRVVGWVRIWGFGLPFYLVYVAAGYSLAAGWLSRRLGTRWKPVLLVAVALLYGYLTTAWTMRPDDAAAELRGAAGEVERATEFLSQRVDDDDVIAVISPDSPAFWYYARRYGIAQRLFEVQRDGLDEVYVVLNTESGHTVEQVITLRSGLNDKVHLEDAEWLYESRVIAIYRLAVDE